MASEEIGAPRSGFELIRDLGVRLAEEQLRIHYPAGCPCDRCKLAVLLLDAVKETEKVRMAQGTS